MRWRALLLAVPLAFAAGAGVASIVVSPAASTTHHPAAAAHVRVPAGAPVPGGPVQLLPYDTHSAPLSRRQIIRIRRQILRDKNMPTPIPVEP
jgi:hypothetical protein